MGLDHALNILPQDKFSEDEVKELVNLGFTREQVSIKFLLFYSYKT